MAVKLSQTLTGYDCNFLSEPPDELKCLICLFVARDPRQHEECGKLFCSECIEKYGTDKPCPNCKKTGAQFYKDHRGRRNVSELKVKCDNVERKCEWVGTVGTLQEHVDTCQFALVPCPKECKDGNEQVKCIMKKEIEEHLEKDCPNRYYTCEYCGEGGTYASITDDHDKTCPKKILLCPNKGCTATMQHQDINEHVDKCEHTVIACKYETIGCETELKRKDMAAHEEDDKLHLHMAIDMTVKLESDLQDLKLTLKKGELIKLKLTDFQQHKNNDEEVFSPTYYISPNGYHIALGVYANGEGASRGSHISVYAHFFKGRNDAELKWPFVGTITFTLLNQLEDKNHHQRTCETGECFNVLVGIGHGLRAFIRHSKLGYRRVKNTQYLKDDTLHFRIEVEVADSKPWLE